MVNKEFGDEQEKRRMGGTGNTGGFVGIGPGFYGLR
jgi:hypothetical protein